MVVRCSSVLSGYPRGKLSTLGALLAPALTSLSSSGLSSSFSHSPAFYPHGALLTRTSNPDRGLATTSTPTKLPRVKGKVKFFDRKRGFGYIIEDTTKKEYYANRKGIVPDERATVYNTFYGENFVKSKSLRGSSREAYLVNNEIVEFELEIDPDTNHERCVDITGPERGQLYFRARRRWNMPINENYFYNKGKQRCTLSFNEAQFLINKRFAARESRDWQKADELKMKLRGHGIEVNDDTGKWNALDGSIWGSCHELQSLDTGETMSMDDCNFSDEYNVSHLPGNRSRTSNIRNERLQKLYGRNQRSSLLSRNQGGNSKGAFMLPDHKKVSGSIFISNLPKNVHEAELEELMSQIGEVTSVWIKRSKSGLHRGDAVVKFRTDKEAQLAIAKFGEDSSFELQGRKLMVREDRQKIGM